VFRIHFFVVHCAQAIMFGRQKARWEEETRQTVAATKQQCAVEQASALDAQSHDHAQKLEILKESCEVRVVAPANLKKSSTG
jgi:hypothetical protein